MLIKTHCYTDKYLTMIDKNTLKSWPKTVTLSYVNPNTGGIMATTTVNLLTVSPGHSITVSTLHLDEEITLTWNGREYHTNLLGADMICTKIDPC